MLSAPLEGRARKRRAPPEAVVRPVKANNDPYFTPDVPSCGRRAVVKSPTLCWGVSHTATSTTSLRTRVGRWRRCC